MAGKPKAKVQRWRPDDEPLTPAVINQIRWSIRDKAHDSAQARRLLSGFIEQRHGAADGRVTAELVGYLCEAFEAYLANPKKGRLEAALGLTAPKRRPPSVRTEQRHDLLALHVLQERLRGRKHDAALADAGARFSVSRSQAEKVWLANREFAFSIECVRRHQAGRQRPLFEPSEAKILRRIYGAAIIDKPYITADSPK